MVNMAGDPDCRMRKVVFVVLPKRARYSDVLQVRHFVFDRGVRRTSPKGLFMIKQKSLCLSKEKIRRAAYRWRIDCACGRDCVSLKLEPAWPFLER